MIRAVSVRNAEQLRAVLAAGNCPERIYLPYPVFLGQDRELAAAAGLAGRTQIFADLPYLFRQEPGMPAEEDMENLLGDTVVPMDGLLAHNLEEASFIRDKGYRGILETDFQIPVWNAEAAGVFAGLFEEAHWEWTVSPEFSLYEIRELLGALREKKKADPAAAGIVIYGRVPMMVSANCVRKTAGRCTGRCGEFAGFSDTLRDRKGKMLPVTGDCRVCYNVILNAVPTSLHRYPDEIRDLDLGRVRIDLTTETAEETAEILRVFAGNADTQGPAAETTAGRFKKGVE